MLKTNTPESITGKTEIQENEDSNSETIEPDIISLDTAEANTIDNPDKETSQDCPKTYPISMNNTNTKNVTENFEEYGEAESDYSEEGEPNPEDSSLLEIYARETLSPQTIPGSKILPTKTIIEGLLFIADGPLSLEQLEGAFEDGISKNTIEDILTELTQEYESMDRAFDLRVVAGGYQFRTRPGLSTYALRLKKKAPARLSRAAMETLAVIAYRQPILRAEVEKIRGVDAGGVIRALLEKDLIRITSRRENLPGRPMLYGTTEKFLQTFDLPSISSLPSIEELETLSAKEEGLLF